jgi:hypothetical protein
MEKVDKDNGNSKDISSIESNNNRNIIEEVLKPFIIQEGEKEIAEGKEKPKASIHSKEEGTTNQTQSNQNTVSDDISNTADLLGDLNTIKDELIKLPLNPAEKDYLEVYVFPLLSILLDLSTTSLNLSSSTGRLAVSYVTNPKISRLKDTEHLVYDINDKCEDVYKILKQRINYVLKCNEK